MKFNFLLFVLILIALPLHAGSLPYGTWRYTVYQEDKQVGTAKIKRSIQSQTIVTVSDISFYLEDTFTISRETIKERGDFYPIQYETESTFITKDTAKRVSMLAEVKQQTLHVSDGHKTLKFKVTQDFNFGSNILFATLLKSGLKAQNSSTINLYDPSLSPTKTIKAKMICHSQTETMCGNKSVKLYKITVKHKTKILYTLFCDTSGVIHKYIVPFNNSNLVLTLASYDS